MCTEQMSSSLFFFFYKGYFLTSLFSFLKLHKGKKKKKNACHVTKNMGRATESRNIVDKIKMIIRIENSTVLWCK